MPGKLSLDFPAAPPAAHSGLFSNFGLTVAILLHRETNVVYRVIGP
jgi:hypothetical protein